MYPININVRELIDDDIGRCQTEPRHCSTLQIQNWKHIIRPISRPCLAVACKLGLWKRLVYSGLVLEWFFEFERYWEKRLKGRPLHPADFWFLYSKYRQDFDVEIPSNETAESHRISWQDERIIYLLFFNQIKTALNPLEGWRYRRYIKRGASVLEYGCGLAPIATSFSRYWPELRIRFTLADIPTIMWDFVQWKFCNCKKYFSFIQLGNDCRTPLPQAEYFDVAFCKAVLEHVIDPLTVVENIHSALKAKGILAVDYIKSHGTGLDSKRSLSMRGTTIQFLRENFDIIEGSLPIEGNVESVVLRKR